MEGCVAKPRASDDRCRLYSTPVYCWLQYSRCGHICSGRFPGACPQQTRMGGYKDCDWRGVLASLNSQEVADNRRALACPPQDQPALGKQLAGLATTGSPSTWRQLRIRLPSSRPQWSPCCPRKYARAPSREALGCLTCRQQLSACTPVAIHHVHSSQCCSCSVVASHQPAASQELLHAS